jgi:hypothetical protein
MGDNLSGAPTPENAADPAAQEMAMTEASMEMDIRNKLLTESYGTKIPQRRAVDRSQ